MERTEAIEVIRENWPHVRFSGTEFETALRELIPELKESEDERIRKEIRNFLIDMECKEEWISYLEKLKEQKPAEWKPLPESMEALLLAIEGKWDAIKPTGYMSRRLEDLYDGLVNTFDVDEKYLSNLPKTEYTEKDIEEIKALKEKIDSSMETKPAEWSEEEKGILLRCISALQNSSHWLLADKLSSLRPQSHWRPSEEQMRAVFDASERNDGLGSVLRNLYNDLKKL